MRTSDLAMHGVMSQDVFATLMWILQDRLDAEKKLGTETLDTNDLASLGTTCSHFDDLASKVLTEAGVGPE